LVGGVYIKVLANQGLWDKWVARSRQATEDSGRR
jgi:hypothetical protein